MACKCDSQSDNSVIILHTCTHIQLATSSIVFLWLLRPSGKIHIHIHLNILLMQVFYLHVLGMCAEIANLDFPSSYLIITFNPSRSNREVSVAGGKRWLDRKIPQLKGFSIKVIWTFSMLDDWKCMIKSCRYCWPSRRKLNLSIVANWIRTW